MSFVLPAAALLLLAFWFWIFVGSLQPSPLPMLPAASEGKRANVSIVVAMRNEAKRLLRESVPSILAQAGAGDEVIFVDDHSNDETVSIVADLIGGDPRARIVRSEDGRDGKREALAQGAAISTNALLLFIDADVLIGPEAARRTVEVAEREEIDCISIFPQTIAISFWERLALVATSWVIFAGSWFRRTNDDKHPVGLGVAGVFLFVRRTAYQAIGGFEAIGTNVLEDVAFANKIRERGYGYRYFRADGLVQHRMYRSLQEIIDGMSKNTFPALGGKLLLACLAGTAFSCVLLGPPLLFFSSIARALTHHDLLSMLVPICSGYTLPWMYRSQERASRLMGTAPGKGATILSPLGVPIWIWILARSIYMNRFRERVFWRGRWIDPRPDSSPDSSPDSLRRSR